MLDIDRVNDILNGKVSGRGAGHTTAMLVKMLAETEINQPAKIFVECATYKLADFIRFRCYQVMLDMGWSPEEVCKCKATRLLRIGKSVIMFVGQIREIDRLGMHDVPIYRDNSVWTL
jgi:hypothetical protein